MIILPGKRHKLNPIILSPDNWEYGGELGTCYVWKFRRDVDTGYPMINITVAGKRRVCKVHHLITDHYLMPGNYDIVQNDECIPACINPDHFDVIQSVVRGPSKLTPEEVWHIKFIELQGKTYFPQSLVDELSERFMVSPQTIYNIGKRLTWTNIHSDFCENVSDYVEIGGG